MICEECGKPIMTLGYALARLVIFCAGGWLFIPAANSIYPELGWLIVGGWLLFTSSNAPGEKWCSCGAERSSDERPQRR